MRKRMRDIGEEEGRVDQSEADRDNRDRKIHMSIAVLIIDMQNRSRMTKKHPQRDEEIDEKINEEVDEETEEKMVKKQMEEKTEEEMKEETDVEIFGPKRMADDVQ